MNNIISSMPNEMALYYRVVLSRSSGEVEAGTVFGEYHSYYSAVMAASDSPYSDDLDILDVRQGGYND